MRILRIRIDEEAKPNKAGYYAAYENERKGGNAKAPDFKGRGVAVWLNSVDDSAEEAGAEDETGGEAGDAEKEEA